MTTDFWAIQWKWLGDGSDQQEWMLWSDDPTGTGKVAPRLFFSKAEAEQFRSGNQPDGTMFATVRVKLKVIG